MDHLLALLLRTHDRGNFGLNIRTDHMDGGGAGLEADAVASPLPNDLRLLQHQGIDGGHHDAVAGLLHLLQSVCHLVICCLDSSQLGQQRDQISVVLDLEAGLLGQSVVEQGPGQVQYRSGQPGA